MAVGREIIQIARYTESNLVHQSQKHKHEHKLELLWSGKEINGRSKASEREGEGARERECERVEKSQNKMAYLVGRGWGGFDHIQAPQILCGFLPIITFIFYS